MSVSTQQTYVCWFSLFFCLVVLCKNATPQASSSGSNITEIYNVLTLKAVSGDIINIVQEVVVLVDLVLMMVELLPERGQLLAGES